MRSYVREVTGIAAGADDNGIALDQSVVGAVADRNGIALAQNPAAATPLTLEAGAAALSPARLIEIYSAADVSTVTFAVVGLDENGDPASENIVGPDTSPDTVSSVNRYSSITSITPDNTIAQDVEVGWDTVSGKELTLEAGAADLDPPRRIIIDTGDDLSGDTFTIVGTDRAGTVITEDIVGGNGAPVTSTKVYASVTSITVAGVGEGTAVVGWGEEVIGAWLFLGHGHESFAYGVEVEGTVNYDLEKTYRNILREGINGDYEVGAFDEQTNKAVNSDGSFASGVGALRLVINSGTGTARLRVIPARGL